LERDASGVERCDWSRGEEIEDTNRFVRKRKRDKHIHLTRKNVGLYRPCKKPFFLMRLRLFPNTGLYSGLVIPKYGIILSTDLNYG